MPEPVPDEVADAGVRRPRRGRYRIPIRCCPWCAGQVHGSRRARRRGGDVLAFVVGLLASGQCQLDLDTPSRKYSDSGTSVRFTVPDLAHERVDFPTVQQQLSVAPRGVVGQVPW